MFEITIKNLEDGKVTDYTAEGFALMVMKEDDDTSVDLRETSIDNISNVIGMSGTLRAAARIGIAKYDGRKDVDEEKGREKMEGVMELLKKMAEDD